jgi:hypothetical protein
MARFFSFATLALSPWLFQCGSTAGPGASSGDTPDTTKHVETLEDVSTSDLIAIIKTGHGSTAEMTMRFKMDAIWVLGDRRQDAASSVPCLVELIRSETTEPPLYIAAVDSLGRLGPSAEAAVPTLIDQLPKAIRKKARLDDGSVVIAAVDSALERITGQHFGRNQARWQSWLKERTGQP